MDTSSVLEKYTQDLSNLPLEVRHLLDELRSKDLQLMEARKRYHAKDASLHKFIRANGTLTKYPKEGQIYTKVKEEMKTVQRIQSEKVLLANTALFLVSKHLYAFETDIARLERDELLPILENDVWDSEAAALGDPSRRGSYSGLGSASDDATLGAGTPSRSHTPLADYLSNGNNRKKRRYTPGHSRAASSIANMNRTTKTARTEDEIDARADSPGQGFDITLSVYAMGDDQQASGTNEDADNNLYCFCQRVLFGEMIGCDNDDCKYEWFHWSCVGISSPPKDDEIWYCPDCAPKMEKSRKRKKK